MLAIESCNQNNIKPSLQCVLFVYNLESIEYILEMAKKLDVRVLFQPAISELLWSKEVNLQAPPVRQYRQVIMKLIDAKKRSFYTQLTSRIEAYLSLAYFD